MRLPGVATRQGDPGSIVGGAHCLWVATLNSKENQRVRFRDAEAVGNRGHERGSASCKCTVPLLWSPLF